MVAGFKSGSRMVTAGRLRRRLGGGRPAWSGLDVGHVIAAGFPAPAHLPGYDRGDLPSKEIVPPSFRLAEVRGAREAGRTA